MTSKNTKYWLIGIVLLTIMIALLFFYNLWIPILTLPQRISCERKGGEWVRGGASGIPACNFRTTDAGKECSDSDDCQGACLLKRELTPEEQKAFRNRKRISDIIPVKGECSSNTFNIGCLTCKIH